MGHFLKPYSLLLYLLASIAFFFVGLGVAGLVGAGKNQGLAGGAIVLGYGVITAFFSFIAAIILVSNSNKSLIVKCNKILTIVIITFIGYFTWNYQTNIKPKREANEKPIAPKQKTASPTTEPIALLVDNSNNYYVDNYEQMGMGMFSPIVDEVSPLYFYKNPNLEKSIGDYIPYNSITFKKLEYGGFDIATAPPWLVPQHLKLDYNILFFKVQSISQEYIEITVNAINNQTSLVNRYSGKLMYWPEFLLSVNSVEFTNPTKETIFVKPLDYAGSVNLKYSFMKPLRINHNWMYVELLNDDYDAVGKGWIKWNKNGKLLIEYSLLS